MKIKVVDRARKRAVLKSIFTEEELVALLFTAAKTRDGLTEDLSHHRVSIAFVTKKAGVNAVVRMRSPSVAA
jgi:hypothetical protein